MGLIYVPVNKVVLALNSYYAHYDEYRYTFQEQLTAILDRIILHFVPKTILSSFKHSLHLDK